MQLYGYGLLFNLLLVGHTAPQAMGAGFFDGWNTWTVFTAVTLGNLGLAVSGVLKYASVVTKVVASTASMILSVLLGSLWMGSGADPQLVLSAVVTACAVYLYSLPQLAQHNPDVSVVTDEELRSSTDKYDNQVSPVALRTRSDHSHADMV